MAFKGLASRGFECGSSGSGFGIGFRFDSPKGLELCCFRVPCLGLMRDLRSRFRIGGLVSGFVMDLLWVVSKLMTEKSESGI